MITVDTLPDPSLYWGLLPALLLIAGALAMVEQAVLSTRKTRLEKIIETREVSARAALWAVENEETALFAIRVGTAFVCLAAGSLCLAPLLLDGASRPELSLVGGAFMMTLAGLTAVIAMTARFSSLGSPETLLIRLAWLPRMLSWLLTPVTVITDAAAAMLFRWFDAHRGGDSDEIEEEVCLLLEQGAQDGIFEKVEQDMVERIFTLDDIRASALMTPRTQIVWLDLEEPSETQLETVLDSGHSRFPVGRGSLDEVAGVVFTKDLLSESLRGQNLRLEDHIRTPVFVPKSMNGLRILELFKKAGTHVALVIDEYGGVLGLITINDILEHIVGDLPLADELDEAMVVQREDGSYLVDGMLAIEELRELLDVDELPAEGRENYQTAGGFITSYLERIPVTSESFVWQDWRFEVLDMDRSRIDKILVERVKPEPVFDEVS